MTKAALLIAAMMISVPCLATAEVKSRGALDNTKDLFADVTPDSLLGKTTRRKWLDLYPVNAKIYWAAWDCRGKPCDTPKRAHIRATAKLVPRTDRDPKPMENTGEAVTP